MFIADVGGGAMSSVIGILAALIGRDRHGAGASLDVSMHDAALYWVMLPAARDLVEGGEAATGELPTFGEHASYNIYETKDGRQIALGALERKFWIAFCDGIGRPDLAARHDTDAADQAALVRDMRALFATRTRDEWLGLFAGHEVCLTPVNRPDEALRDPHIAARRHGRGPARPARHSSAVHPAHARPCARPGARRAYGRDSVGAVVASPAGFSPRTFGGLKAADYCGPGIVRPSPNRSIDR